MSLFTEISVARKQRQEHREIRQKLSSDKFELI